MEQRHEPRNMTLAMVEEFERVGVVEVGTPLLRIRIAGQGVEREPPVLIAARSSMVSITYCRHCSSDVVCFTLKIPLASV